MSPHACALGINNECLGAYPSFGRRALAYRVLWRVVPAAVLGVVGGGFNKALIAPGVEVPAGVELPGGWVVFPEAVFPPGWVLGDAVPAGVFSPPRFVPLLPEAGIGEPLFVGLFGGGPVHRVAPAAGLAWESYLNGDYWEEVVVVGYELGSVRWSTDHWKVYYCVVASVDRWGRLNVKTGTSWATDFRPSKCRVTFSGGSDPVKIALYDTGANVLGQDVSAVSPVEIDLDFSGGLDIRDLRICDAVSGSHTLLSFFITGIEFA